MYHRLQSSFYLFLVPCGPGQFYQSGSCTSCGEGFYQTGADGTCQKCDQGQTSNAAGTGCICKLLYSALALIMLDIIMYYTTPIFYQIYLVGFQTLICIYKQSGKPGWILISWLQVWIYIVSKDASRFSITMFQLTK